MMRIILGSPASSAHSIETPSVPDGAQRARPTPIHGLDTMTAARDAVGAKLALETVSALAAWRAAGAHRAAALQVLRDEAEPPVELALLDDAELSIYRRHAPGVVASYLVGGLDALGRYVDALVDNRANQALFLRFLDHVNTRQEARFVALVRDEPRLAGAVGFVVANKHRRALFTTYTTDADQLFYRTRLLPAVAAYDAVPSLPAKKQALSAYVVANLYPEVGEPSHLSAFCSGVAEHMGRGATAQSAFRLASQGHPVDTAHIMMPRRRDGGVPRGVVEVGVPRPTLAAAGSHDASSHAQPTLPPGTASVAAAPEPQAPAAKGKKRASRYWYYKSESPEPRPQALKRRTLNSTLAAGAVPPEMAAAEAAMGAPAEQAEHAAPRARVAPIPKRRARRTEKPAALGSLLDLASPAFGEAALSPGGEGEKLSASAALTPTQAAAAFGTEPLPPVQPMRFAFKGPGMTADLTAAQVFLLTQHAPLPTSTAAGLQENVLLAGEPLRIGREDLRNLLGLGRR